MSKKIYGFLLLILVVGGLVRLPGMYWGCHGHDVWLYHPDELRLGKDARHAFYEGHSRDYYPPGYIRITSLVLKLIGSEGGKVDVFIAANRWNSFMHGVASILLVFLITRAIGQSPFYALASTAIYAFAGTSIIYSHYGAADMTMVFWFLFSVYGAILTIQKKSLYAWLMTTAAAGIAIAVKLAWPALIPVFTASWGLRAKHRWFMITTGLLLTVFFADWMAGWIFDPAKLTQLGYMIHNDNLFAIQQHNYAANVFVNLLQLLPSLGLPGFLLACYGISNHWKKRQTQLTSDQFLIFFTFTAPTVLVFINACALAVIFTRHLFPLVPLLAILAGNGLASLYHEKLKYVSQRTVIILAGFFILYQAVYVFSIVGPYWNDSRERMGTWVSQHLPRDAKFYITRYAFSYPFEKYVQAVTSDNAEYVMLHEGYARRYMRSIINPLKKFPDPDEIYHSKGDAVFIQGILQEKLPFREIHREKARHVTPELWLFKKYFGTFPDFNGDTILYIKNTSSP